MARIATLYEWKYARIALAVILCCILADMSQSVYEMSRQPVLGDVVPLILPDDRNAPILTDPFGFKALKQDVYHPNINRFFCSITLYYYLRELPLILQRFCDPVQSLYLSIFLLKFLLFGGIIFMISTYISVSESEWKYLVFAFFLIQPYFQLGSGIFGLLTIVDNSIVYAVFYAFPVLLLLVLAWPFWKYFRGRSTSQNSAWQIALIFLLGLVVSFSSAILPPTILLITTLYLLELFLRKAHVVKRSSKVPRWHIFFMMYMWILNAYSLLLSGYNSENINQLPIIDRYHLWWQGIINFFFNGTFTIIFATIIIALVLAKRNKFRVWKGKFRGFLYYSGIFTCSYLLLLPWGGYREYRPEIVRHDTLLPISILACIIVGVLCWELYRRLPLRNLNLLTIWLILSVSAYSWVDYKTVPSGKDCEQAILYDLHHADETTTVLEYEDDCFVTTWYAVKDSSFYENHAAMWEYWNITDHKILLSFKNAPW